MVIQRWQTVLLLVCCAVMAVFTFCSLGQIQTESFTLNFTTLGLTYEGEPSNGAPSGYMLRTWYFFAVSLLSAVLPLLTVFCYKKGGLQKRLCLVEVLLIVAASTVGGLLGYCTVEGGVIGWSTVIICPLLGLAAVIMAYNRISHDINLLRSVERFR